MILNDYKDLRLKSALERHPLVVDIAHSKEWNGKNIAELKGTDKERVVRFMVDAYGTPPTIIQMYSALQMVRKLTKDFTPWAMTDADGKAESIYEAVKDVIKFNQRTTAKQRTALLCLLALCQRRGQVIEQFTK